MVPKDILGGLLIVFEGIDGVGKTTQLKLAEDSLRGEGKSVLVTRNLGGTPIGEELRRVMLAPVPRPVETDLYISVAIQEALVPAIAEERRKNDIILMDRGPLSLAAYQIYGSGLDADLGWLHVRRGMDGLKPDLTIIYTADVKTALGRLQQESKSTDYFESKPEGYFDDVAKGYLEAAQSYKDSVVLIDAGQPIEAVHKQTMAAILQINQTT